MENVIALPTLYKRDTKGKVRVLTIEYGFDNEDTAGTRSIAGIQNGKLVTSGWNITEPKNVGKVNATTCVTQALAEAQASWDKKVEKEYFADISQIDTYEKFKPMLAGDYTKRPQEQGWSQPKLDGIRCIANQSGQLINRITFTTTQVSTAASDAVKTIVREGFLLVGLFAYLMFLNFKLTLLLIITAPLIALIVYVAGKRLKKLATKIQKRNSLL